MNSSQIFDTIKLPCAILKKREDRVIEYSLTEDYILDVDDINQLVDAVRELCLDEKHAMLVVTTDNNGSTREARNTSFERMKQKDHAISEAVVIKSLPTRMAADFFYKIYKPHHPYKFFKTKEKAEAWTKLQVQKYLEQ